LARVLVDGKHVYLGKYNSEASKEAYRRILAEMGRPAAKAVEAGDGLSVVELLAAYYKYCQGYYPETSAEPLRFIEATRELRATYGRTMAVEFGPLKLKAVRQIMVDGVAILEN